MRDGKFNQFNFNSLFKPSLNKTRFITNFAKCRIEKGEIFISMNLRFMVLVIIQNDFYNLSLKNMTELSIIDLLLKTSHKLYKSNQ